MKPYFLRSSSTLTGQVLPALRLAGAASLLALAAGCATGPQASPQDPFEPFNRGVSTFNDRVDDAVLRPVATAYRKVLPSPIRAGVGNFFDNLSDVWSFVNSALQLKVQNTAETFMRVSVNTVFGLAGVLDVATEAGLYRHSEDFGQTLGRWGVGSGPYVVLPLLGPSTLRDTAALPVDRLGSVFGYVNDIPVRNSMYLLRAVDIRANLLRATQLIGDAALDKYTFTRDAYLQRRRNEVYDGNVPDNDDSDR